ncbi:MAG: substrate-binding domain-containing protein [Treponema sp.]|jgi:phosphate transport system substrate-binding protein|nr:substrate-binding domain-containing protein [Treponema sp.]
MRNRKILIIGLLMVGLLALCSFFAGCKNEDEDEEDDINPQLKIIEGFDLNNYPKADGSTSAYSLNVLIACKLLGIKHQWVQDSYLGWNIEPVLKSKKNSQRFAELVKSSQTHNSFINLIDKKADIILSARKMSPSEKTYADAAGVSLIETPIALDAFIFIINPYNPLTSLTINQIQNIYTGKITNWNEVGGEAFPIQPYVRNRDSGSQEVMESLVMKDLDITEFPVSWEVVHSMTGAFEAVKGDNNGICYTFYYYREYVLKELEVKSLAIEGIYPNKESINNNTYPLATEVYAVILSDLDKSSTAYKLYEFLQTEKGKEVINESGYLPN